MKRLKEISKDTPWILLWFGLYILLAVIFGSIYYKIYQKNVSAFSITSNPYNQTLIKYEDLRIILFESMTSLKTIFSKNQINIVDLMETSIDVDDRISDNNKEIRLYKIDPDWKNKLADKYNLSDNTIELLKLNIEKYLSAREIFLQTWTELDRLISFKNKENLADFIYFSIATITTVGYGDITPTNTKVRVIVGIELMIFIFFTLFGINYFLNR